MAGRIVRSEDFERVLAQPARARSPHFAVHFATGLPSRPAGRKRPADGVREAGRHKLSTETEQTCQEAVDDCHATGFATRFWLGTVVPKRHARRAVTRSLIKRQVRSAVARLDATGARLAPGLWVVRLRAPFDRAVFTSAASEALRSAARQELETLLVQCRSRPLAALPAS